MTLATIDWIAVLVATVASMATGAAWYGTLAKPWMAAAGLTETDVRSDPKLYVRAALCQLVMAGIHGTLFAHLGGATLGQALILAVALWAGFVITSMAVNHGFQGQSFSLTMIDGGYWLAVLVVQGIVFGSLAG